MAEMLDVIELIRKTRITRTMRMRKTIGSMIRVQYSVSLDGANAGMLCTESCFGRY